MTVKDLYKLLGEILDEKPEAGAVELEFWEDVNYEPITFVPDNPENTIRHEIVGLEYLGIMI